MLHLAVNILCLILLPVLLYVIYRSFTDAFDYYNRNQSTEPEGGYVYMSDLFENKKD